MSLPAAPVRLCGAFALLATVLVVTPAFSQVPLAPAAQTADEESAQRHFDHALEEYRAGHYASALRSLKEAARLDPSGKDLFFNLALVHEKLGQLPEAIAALERFSALEPDAAEREKVRLTIARLQGAQQELGLPVAVAPVPCPEPPPPAAPSERGPSPVLIGAATVALASLAIGTVFGLQALSNDVSGASTSSSLSVAQLRERARRAERQALIADVAFAVTAASAATFAGVWWLSSGAAEERAAGVTVRGYF